MPTSLRFEIIKDLAAAERWWNHFSPHQTIYDEWEFRYCFYKYFNFELFFFLGYYQDQPIGLLPLQFNQTQHYLEFFGDHNAWMDGNRVFIAEAWQQYIPHFYQALSRPSKLTYIVGEDDFTRQLPPDNATYILTLTNLNKFEDYLIRDFDSDTRGKFRRKYKKIAAQPIEIITNNFSDLEDLFKLNIQTFGDHSSFNNPLRKKIFFDLAKLALPQYLFTFKINETIMAVSYSICFRDTYVYLNIGSNRETTPTINSYVTLFNIDQAIKAKMNFFDARGGDYGWKELWHFAKIPQYKFSFPEDVHLLSAKM